VKRGSFRDWRDARVDVEDYQQLDIERILALLDLIGRGRASGVEIARPQSQFVPYLRRKGHAVGSVLRPRARVRRPGLRA
jgi:hypothetical protein